VLSVAGAGAAFNH